jgi:hypothetical protein
MALTLASLEGCASLMPAQPAPSGAAPAGAPAGAAAGAQGTGAAVTAHAPVDSLPSSEAQRVLDSIPEPIPAAERVPPPAVAAAGAGAAAASDSAADSLGAAVPVPAPTAPLGDKPGSAELAAAAGGVAAMPDSLGASATGAKAGAAAAGAAAGTAGAAASKPAASSGAAAASGGAKPAGPCYRLQVAAPKDRTQAESMKRAAESQLEVPFTITKVQTLYKVRTRDCLDEDAVQHLRARARASGFSGAFTTTEGAK